MSKGMITKELFTKCLIPLAYCFAVIYTLWSAWVQYDPDITMYMTIVLAFGLPIGIRKMFLWLVPTEFGSLGVSAAIIILDFAIGGLIGAVLLVWFLFRGLWYIPLTIFRYINSPKNK